MEQSGLVYTPPFDNECSDNEYAKDDAKSNSAIPPRQSAIPNKLVAKQQKDFHTDEHPEVPKIRRASLKQIKVGILPIADGEGNETAPHARISGKMVNETRRPFSNPTVESRSETGEIAPYPRHARKNAQRTMLPLTGLESADEIRAWQNETGYHKRIPRKRDHDELLPFDGLGTVEEHKADTAAQEKFSWQDWAIRQITQHTEGMRVLKIPRRRPGSGTGPTTDPGRFYHIKLPIFERKQTWVLLGLLTMLMLIFAPLIFHSIGSSTQKTRINLTGQGSTLAGLPGIPANPHELVVTPPNTDHPVPPIFATSAYLLDQDHETTLYAQNPFLHLPMLSTTKLMTASLAMEKGNLDQQVTISPLMQQEIDQLSADSALFGVKQGETYTLRDLLYGLLYVSGNDAALVIANVVGGSVPHFVAMMNQKAQSLGMLDTHFVNPHGLLDDGQYSCAHDLAVLGQYSLNIPTLQKMSSGKTYQIAAGGNHIARALLNENQFLWWYPGATGGKTGFDGVSDFVQVISTTRNNHHLIGVVMHTNNWWTDMRDLMDYGSTDYTWSSPHDVDASGQLVPYDTLWNYFASDTPHFIIPMGEQGRYYVYTGYTVSGSILAYFDQQGGLPKFGFPVKMPIPSGTLITQRFQQGSIQCNTSNQQCHMV